MRLGWRLKFKAGSPKKQAHPALVSAKFRRQPDMGKVLSRLQGGGWVSRKPGESFLLSKLHQLGLLPELEQLKQKSLKATELSSSMVELDQRLKLREDQVTQLSQELEMQREHRHQLMAQADRTAEERRLFEERSQETHFAILKEIELLRAQTPDTPVLPAAKIGEQGEDYVLECLQKAFPNNTSICRTNGPHMGDIFFKVENSDIVIMFEVKDHKAGSGTIMGKSNGSMLDKFYQDLKGSQVDAGVLISLNGPVDPKTAPFTPMWTDSKPCVYIDSMRSQYPDPECAVKAVVVMMQFLVERHREGGHSQDFGQKINGYLCAMKGLLQTYQKLYKNNLADSRSLQQLKGDMDQLQTTMLRDKALDKEEGGT